METVNKTSPQGQDGHLDQSQVDWLSFMPDGWDGTPPVVPRHDQDATENVRKLVERYERIIEELKGANNGAGK